MKYVGYHRVSTKEQNLDRGIAEIKAFCAERKIELHKNKVYTDQQTGKNFNRPKYAILKEEVLEKGDTLIITEIDRLGRDKHSTMNELRAFKDSGIRVMCLELPTTLIDRQKMGSDEMAQMMLETINNMMIELYASMAHAEMKKREKRQREGIEAKKKRGEWGEYGRPRVMSHSQFKKHYEVVERGEKTKAQLMRDLDMHPSTFFRYQKELKANLPCE